MATEINRRRFLTQATLTMLALRVGAGARVNLPAAKFVDDDITAVREHLLSMVNSERREAGLSTLKLDQLACDVAQKHAIEMAENNFLSHWGVDGRKPYHRYAQAGGTDATAENDAAADYSAPFPADDFLDAPGRMHKAMHDETPPNDGHRQTMLTPQHTHVGFGVATRGLHIRLCEVYVSRYMTIDPYPLVKAPQSRFLFSGRVLDPRYSFEGIDVFFEPPPAPPDKKWLETPRPYSLPENPTTLYVKLGENKFYDDGSKGTIEIPSRGRFRVPVDLTRKQPGIYTLVVWLSRSETDRPFPATHVCIRAE